VLSKALLAHYKDHFQKKIRDPNIKSGRIISGDQCVDNWVKEINAMRKLVVVEPKAVDFEVHEKDQEVYETAYGGASDLIITTNSRHFPIGDQVLTFRIISPENYLEEEEKEPQERDTPSKTPKRKKDHKHDSPIAT
jgi:predicted nucleic acid-binding protein